MLMTEPSAVFRKTMIGAPIWHASIHPSGLKVAEIKASDPYVDGIVTDIDHL